MRKITLEIDEADARLIKKTYDIEAEKLVRNIVNVIIEKLVEAAIVCEAGVPIDMRKIDEMGKEIGLKIFRDSISDKENQRK